MRIQNNMMALNTYRQYNIANNQTAGYAEKLSSGYQINRAGDDAAGLAISEKMRAQIRGLNMASKNSLDAVSLIQTAEGALQSTHDILQRMRELAVQSASDTNEQVIDRGALDQEFQALKAEIDDTARTTRFNDQNLIDGTFQKAFYSTDITASKLTAQTVADVNRVGVKSNHNMNGVYNINVKYIEAQQVQYASKSQVYFDIVNAGDQVLTNDVNATSLIKNIEFDAVVGAAHNGKTFTISASGEGNELFDDNDGLKVSITDGDTVYTGTVTATNRMNGGSVITINFDGVGEMTINLLDEIVPDKQEVFNIASMLNTKQFTFAKAPEILDTTTGLGRTGVTSTTPLAIAGVGGGTLTATADTEPTKTGVVNLAGVTGITWGTTPATGAASAFDGTFTFTVDGQDYTGTISGTTGAVLNAPASGVQIDLGDYGVYDVSASVSGASDTLAAFTTGALAAITGATVNFTTTGYEDYSLNTKFQPTSSTKYERTNLDASGATITVNAQGAVTVGGNFVITNEDGTAHTTIAGTAVTATLSNPSDLESAQSLTFTLGDYGKFTVEISASQGRTQAELTTDLTAAIAALSIDLGAEAEGQDTIKGTPAQIALSLNGEVVVVEQNDTKVTFNSSGVSLTFRPLDFSKVTDNASATAKFTTNGSYDTISVQVVENAGKALTIQTGANQGDELDINIDAMNLQMLGLTDSSIDTQKNASRAITEVNNAINQVSTQRAALGALQNRLNFKIANLDTSAENLQAAESRIRDTDMAKVMTAFTKSNILGQAATAMLAQANSQPQNVLQLLR